MGSSITVQLKFSSGEEPLGVAQDPFYEWILILQPSCATTIQSVRNGLRIWQRFNKKKPLLSPYCNCWVGINSWGLGATLHGIAADKPLVPCLWRPDASIYAGSNEANEFIQAISSTVVPTTLYPMEILVGRDRQIFLCRRERLSMLKSIGYVHVGGMYTTPERPSYYLYKRQIEPVPWKTVSTSLFGAEFPEEMSPFRSSHTRLGGFVNFTDSTKNAVYFGPPVVRWGKSMKWDQEIKFALEDYLGRNILIGLTGEIGIDSEVPHVVEYDPQIPFSMI